MARSQVATPPLLTIGAVIAELRSDYPDITISKIRFLESAGLVEPVRTPSGYRKFASAHVERLRYILRMQRDHFLPLRVIGEHLEAIDRGLQPPVPTDNRPRVPDDGDSPAVEAVAGSGSGGPAMRISRAELGDEVGFTLREIVAVQEAGFIRPMSDGNHFGADAARVVRVLAQLGELGLDIRHLAPTRRAAVQQFERVEALVLSARRDRALPADDQLRARARRLAALQLELQAVLLRNAVEELLEGTGQH